MSTGKFASITASILARKGEAKPWQEPEKQTPQWPENPPEQLFVVRPAEVSNLVRPLPAPPVPERPAPDRAPASMPQKKYAMRMSFQEYERLGILAVKKDSTRQQLLREALAQLFTALAKDYRNQCPCLERCDDNGCGCAAEAEPVAT